ncbi:transporter substrate-binding domain-containing protein [Paucibacter sp. TC2R-5]|uniref:substrate-binding periplasmic protein n=1 Tax=Paucibacter sp. TC2R-5 TaxID=2893555 RepID=UPI0021E4569B|nr:transporter substrate-binding domain-containing protein [Paucibacter sp. TC2R-5]MCV2358246.1 transporter substrate-binding domain-containing protein [Paucibacter sp. TC2R-5]
MARRTWEKPGLGLAIVLAWSISFGAMSAAPPLNFVTESFPPYTYAQGGQAAGPMVEVLHEVCAQLKRECRVELLPWRRALRSAERGEVDGILAFVDLPARRKLFYISAPVIDARYVFFARAGQEFNYQGPNSLRGHTVGVYGPSGASLVLADLTQGLDVKTVLEPDNPTVLRKLLAGRYGEQGLVLLNESMALLLMRGEGFGGLQAAGTAKTFGYSFGLSLQRVKRSERQAFDAALSDLCRKGRVADLLKNHGLPASACRKVVNSG